MNYTFQGDLGKSFKNTDEWKKHFLLGELLTLLSHIRIWISRRLRSHMQKCLRVGGGVGKRGPAADVWWKKTTDKKSRETASVIEDSSKTLYKDLFSNLVGPYQPWKISSILTKLIGISPYSLCYLLPSLQGFGSTIPRVPIGLIHIIFPDSRQDSFTKVELHLPSCQVGFL
jgi:hypothetical protein